MKRKKHPAHEAGRLIAGADVKRKKHPAHEAGRLIAGADIKRETYSLTMVYNGVGMRHMYFMCPCRYVIILSASGHGKEKVSLFICPCKEDVAMGKKKFLFLYAPAKKTWPWERKSQSHIQTLKSDEILPKLMKTLLETLLIF